jgi:cytochrome P450
MFNSAKFIANPYPTYNELRSSEPLHYVNTADGAWLLARYSDVVKTLYNPCLSARRSHLIVNRLPAETREEFAEFNRTMAMWMAFLDAPHHNDLRKVLNQGFKPGLLETFRPRFQQIAEALLDKVQDAGQMEFMRDFAYPFPVLVIAEMLGVDPVDQANFITWSDDIVTFMGPHPTLEIARRAQASLAAITDYFRALLPKRRKNLGPDLVSLLLRAEEKGKLTSEQLLAQCSMLLVTGHEAPRSFLGNGLLTLLQHPNQLELLRSNPALMPKALGELLRYESPIKFIARPVIKDFTLYNQQIKQGQFVYALVGAANRDAGKFTRPDTLDVTRPDCAHLSFGSGAHYCLGAPLAYLEAEIAFTALLRRLPNLRLLDRIPDWNSTTALRTLNSLHLLI